MKTEKKGSLAEIPDIAKERILVGEFASSCFRVDFLSINNNFEHAAAGRYELQRGDAMLQLEQFVRQTDGMRLVVSSCAILYGNLQSHNSMLMKR